MIAVALAGGRSSVMGQPTPQGAATMSIHCLAETADATEACGGGLTVGRPGGDSFATIHLVGNLGAGKTTFARGFLRRSGVQGLIRSPTYTLMEIYETPTLSIVHLDLYRLVHPTELEALGLREWARPGHVWLIEWPERGAGYLPLPDLTVELSVASSGHEINVMAGSALGEEWLAAVQTAADGRLGS